MKLEQTVMGEFTKQVLESDVLKLQDAPCSN